MEKNYVDILMESLDTILTQAHIINTLDNDPGIAEDDKMLMFDSCDEKCDQALEAMKKAKALQ